MESGRFNLGVVPWSDLIVRVIDRRANLEQPAIYPHPPPCSSSWYFLRLSRRHDMDSIGSGALIQSGCVTNRVDLEPLVFTQRNRRDASHCPVRKYEQASYPFDLL